MEIDSLFFKNSLINSLTFKGIGIYPFCMIEIISSYDFLDLLSDKHLIASV
jgi:hypothetical protein